jgi:hypothetical protein
MIINMRDGGARTIARWEIIGRKRWIESAGSGNRAAL